MKPKTIEQLQHEKAHYQLLYPRVKTKAKLLLWRHLQKLSREIANFYKSRDSESLLAQVGGGNR